MVISAARSDLSKSDHFYWLLFFLSNLITTDSLFFRKKKPGGDMVLVVVALILGVLLGVFIFIPRDSKSGHSKKFQSNANNNKASKLYSKAEVSLHNKRTDCWIIIKSKVYDVTSYVEEHPGGDAILAHAGDDSTEGFYGPQHATRVFDMIEDFYVGDLDQ